MGTAPLMEEAFLSEACLALANAGRLFCRWGVPPVGGRSYNWDSGDLEAGISCFPVEAASDEMALQLAADISCNAFGQWQASVGETRPLVLVQGTPLEERGADGEILLGACEVVAVLAVDGDRLIPQE